jgi:hypothetical protein
MLVRGLLAVLVFCSNDLYSLHRCWCCWSHNVSHYSQDAHIWSHWDLNPTPRHLSYSGQKIRTNSTAALFGVGGSHKVPCSPVATNNYLDLEVDHAVGAPGRSWVRPVSQILKSARHKTADNTSGNIPFPTEVVLVTGIMTAAWNYHHLSSSTSSTEYRRTFWRSCDVLNSA